MATSRSTGEYSQPLEIDCGDSGIAFHEDEGTDTILEVDEDLKDCLLYKNSNYNQINPIMFQISREITTCNYLDQ